jgi:hypothetical protein
MSGKATCSPRSTRPKSTISSIQAKADLANATVNANLAAITAVRFATLAKDQWSPQQVADLGFRKGLERHYPDVRWTVPPSARARARAREAAGMEIKDGFDFISGRRGLGGFPDDLKPSIVAGLNAVVDRRCGALSEGRVIAKPRSIAFIAVS